MNIDDLREKVSTHKGATLCAVTGFTLVLSAAFMGGQLSDDDGQGQAEQMVSQLQDDKTSAQKTLDDKHAKLLEDLPNADAKRAAGDEKKGRTILSDLVSSSSSSRDVSHQQRFLDAKYDAFDEDSRALTSFVPDWMSATDGANGVGTTYEIKDYRSDVATIRSLDYSYVATAQLMPLGDENDQAEPQYVILTYSTDKQGHITSIDAYRASDDARDALFPKGEDTSTPPSDGGQG